MQAEAHYDTVLSGARVIDPASGFDSIADVAINDGIIAAISRDEPLKSTSIIHLRGCIVTPGLIDLHVHAYGIIGFAYPDSIGVYQGVTSFVDAGSAGVTTFHELSALLRDRLTTDLYAGVMLRPLGLVGVDYAEGDIRGIDEIPFNQWLDLAEQHRDVFKYLKTAAIYRSGRGVVKVAKGLAEILRVPLYLHTGELDGTPPEVITAQGYQIAEQGDMVTHVYHGNPGSILSDDGKVLWEVQDAARRGVLLDVGFGSFNFSFDVAEKAFAQGLLPNLISSDLQQVNVTGPVYSLTHVMSIFLFLGLSLSDVIERVTVAPARAIGLDHKAGSLTVGYPADVTVLKLEEGSYELRDAHGSSRRGTQKLVPLMTFKNGKRYDADLNLAQQTRNWYWHIAEDEIPAAADALEPSQREFLAVLADALEVLDWNGVGIDLVAAKRLHACFYRTRDQYGIPLKSALLAVHNVFFNDPFTYQIGLLLMRMPKHFAIKRMRAAAA